MRCSALTLTRMSPAYASVPTTPVSLPEGSGGEDVLAPSPLFHPGIPRML